MIKSMGDDPDVSTALPMGQAKKLIIRILNEGYFAIGTHAEAELAADRMTTNDVYNVLRYGVIDEPAEEGKHGDWCYRVHTKSMCVVVCFRSLTELAVVTAWRERRGRRS